jgi:hypothetical protein
MGAGCRRCAYQIGNPANRQAPWRNGYRRRRARQKRIFYPHGFLQNVREWSGVGSDITSLLRRFSVSVTKIASMSFALMRTVWALVFAVMPRINELRKAEQRPIMLATPFRGSGGVFDPEDEAVRGDNGKRRA